MDISAINKILVGKENNRKQEKSWIWVKDNKIHYAAAVAVAAPSPPCCTQTSYTILKFCVCAEWKKKKKKGNVTINHLNFWIQEEKKKNERNQATMPQHSSK